MKCPTLEGSRGVRKFQRFQKGPMRKGADVPSAKDANVIFSINLVSY